MIKNLSRTVRLLPVFTKPARPNRHPLALTVPGHLKYGFATYDKASFLSKIEEQLTQQKPENPDWTDGNISFFKSEGWSVSFNSKQSLVDFSKKNPKYEAKVFVKVTAEPPSQQEEPEPEGAVSKVKFSSAVIWSRKKEQSLWMVTQMGILNGEVVLLTVCFRNGTPSLGWEDGTYPGPDVNSLPREVANVVQFLLKQVDLDMKMLINMAIFSSSYADRLDYEWLVDLKQTLQ